VYGSAIGLAGIHPVFPEALFLEFFSLFFPLIHLASLRGGYLFDMSLGLGDEASSGGQFYGGVALVAGFHSEAADFLAVGKAHQIVP